MTHGGIANDARVDVQWVDSERVEKEGPEPFLHEMDGISSLVASAGAASKAWSEPPPMPAEVPLFGICLGMQVAIIEYARNLRPERCE